MHLTDVRACLPCSDDVDARVKLAAKDIARHVQMTAQLVEQLNRLVQRRSLFNDPAQQINDSTAVIKKNLSQQKAQLAALVKLTASRGGSEGVRVACAAWLAVRVASGERVTNSPRLHVLPESGSLDASG